MGMFIGYIPLTVSFKISFSVAVCWLFGHGNVYRVYTTYTLLQKKTDFRWAIELLKVMSGDWANKWCTYLYCGVRGCSIFKSDWNIYPIYCRRVCEQYTSLSQNRRQFESVNDCAWLAHDKHLQLPRYASKWYKWSEGMKKTGMGR